MLVYHAVLLKLAASWGASEESGKDVKISLRRTRSIFLVDSSFQAFALARLGALTCTIDLGKAS